MLRDCVNLINGKIVFRQKRMNWNELQLLGSLELMHPGSTVISASFFYWQFQYSKNGISCLISEQDTTRACNLNVTGHITCVWSMVSCIVFLLPKAFGLHLCGSCGGPLPFGDKTHPSWSLNLFQFRGRMSQFIRRNLENGLGQNRTWKHYFIALCRCKRIREQVM